MPMDNNNTKGVNNPLSLVNPNDIESFTVLKDASATAIYGCLLYTSYAEHGWRGKMAADDVASQPAWEWMRC